MNDFSLFAFDDYKAAFDARLKAMPKAGHGQLRKIAEHLRVNSVVMSQVFRGDKHLTPEQAVDVAGYFGWSELESEYFLLLVQRERAGTQALKRTLGRRVAELRARSTQLKERLPQDKALSEEAKVVFYSSWRYSAVRLLSSIEELQTIDAIAQRLEVPLATAARMVEFLVEHGLCERDGVRVRMGPQRTHLGADSPFVVRHHANWRVKALAKLDSASETDLFFTGPMTLSHQAAAAAREALVQAIRRTTDLATESNADRTACLCIDWFEF